MRLAMATAIPTLVSLHKPNPNPNFLTSLHLSQWPWPSPPIRRISTRSLYPSTQTPSPPPPSYSTLVSSPPFPAVPANPVVDLNPYLQCSMPGRKRLRVAVLLSGGVDSSVALHLLYAAGHSCTAFYLKIWFQVSHIIGEYHYGRTPNPDVLCNTRIKFGAFLEAVENLKFDYIASGHYAHVIHPPFCEKNGPSVLALSKDMLNFCRSRIRPIFSLIYHSISLAGFFFLLVVFQRTQYAGLLV